MADRRSWRCREDFLRPVIGTIVQDVEQRLNLDLRRRIQKIDESMALDNQSTMQELDDSLIANQVSDVDSNQDAKESEFYQNHLAEQLTRPLKEGDKLKHEQYK